MRSIHTYFLKNTAVAAFLIGVFAFPALAQDVPKLSLPLSDIQNYYTSFLELRQLIHNRSAPSEIAESREFFNLRQSLISTQITRQLRRQNQLRPGDSVQVICSYTFITVRVSRNKGTDPSLYAEIAFEQQDLGAEISGVRWRISRP